MCGGGGGVEFEFKQALRHQVKADEGDSMTTGFVRAKLHKEEPGEW